MRLFIAINFDKPTVAGLLDCQNRLRRLGKGNFTTAANLHLTLAFLGEVDDAELDALKAVLDGLTVPELELRFSRVGCFRAGDELWWIGADDNPALTQLQRELTDALLDAGFHPDRKRFRPHITLARRMNIGHADTAQLLPKPFSTRVDTVSLMLSDRVNGALRYTELYSVSGRNG